LALVSNDLEKLLNAAFATNDLHRICRAIDAGVLKSSSIVEIAQAAEVDRTTLYRAFRCEKGPALDTMIKVLRVLGFQLVVEVGYQRAINTANRSSKRGGRRVKNELGPDAKATARIFTAAFRSREIGPLLEAFAETLRAQENVAKFARKTIRARETLYRVFTGSRTPRFSTVLSFLNALGLRFAVRRLPGKLGRGHARS
jgi:probable addiction module antidote protein